jgi:ADP-heptose:LPS heptosyltransferase
MIWLLRWLTPRPRSLHGDSHPPKLPERVICSKFLGLGSVVISLPLLRALKESGVKVAFWTFAGQAEIAKLSGLVDEVWIVRPTLTQFIPTLWKTWRASRDFKADAFLDLEPTANFTSILGRLSGSPQRIGFMSAKPLRESLFTHLVSLTPERHMVENNLWMGRLLGTSPDADTSLPFPPAQVDKIQSPIVPDPARTRIVLNINSSDLSWHRMWPEEHWVALCRELLKDPRTDLIFTGSHSELLRVEALLSKLEPSPRLINIAGKTTLGQVLKVLKDAKLVVSVDSGVMHLAAWMSVPLIGLFGPETPSLYSPRSRKARVLSAGLPCSPCLYVAADKITRCNDNICMKKISPARVLLTCRSLLEQGRAPETAREIEPQFEPKIRPKIAS